MRQSHAILIICLSLFSCEDQFGLNDKELSQKTIDISQQLFMGDIVEKASVKEDNADVWKIKIENEKGSQVTFYWQKNYNIIFKIVGERGPFDYDLHPPLNVLSLSTARFLAFESYSEDILRIWILKRDSSDPRKWIYEFYLNGHEAPVAINATSGDTF